jgi:tetratricopeptide (TPR) repeat protein
MTTVLLATTLLALGSPASDAVPSAPAAQVASESSRSTLEEAFDIASLVPAEVHGRDRAKLQALACEALVRAGEVDRAIGLGSRIDGWRRGEVYAVAALELAKQGKADEATMIAKRALGVAPSVLDWQRERIRVSVARVYAWLGDESGASELEKGAGEPEMGRVAAAKAARIATAAVPAEYFDAQMKSLEDWIRTKNFDLVRNSVEVALEFYPGAIADPARRARIESLVDEAIEQVPYDLRIRFHLRMADALVARGDRDAARARIGRAEAVVRQFKWLAEDEVVQRAAVAEAKIVLGDLDAARGRRGVHAPRRRAEGARGLPARPR